MDALKELLLVKCAQHNFADYRACESSETSVLQLLLFHSGKINCSRSLGSTGLGSVRQVVWGRILTICKRFAGAKMVISSIVVEDRTIKLNQTGVGIPNIFDVDSVSLVIGVNGSGKTFLLNRILDKFTLKAKVDRYSCEIFMDAGRVMSFQEMREAWGAIYYSPIPYGRRLHKSKNFIDASPNWARPLSVFEMRAYEDVLRDFDISPQLYVQKNVDVRKVCRTIVETLIVQPFPRTVIDSEHLRNVTLPLLEFLQKSQASTSSGSLTPDQRVENERREKQFIEKAAMNVHRLIRDHLNSDVESFCVFAVLEKYISRGNRVPQVIESVMHALLRRSDGERDHEPSQFALRALDDIHNSLEFLKGRDAKVKLGSRASLEAKLHLNEKAPLSKSGVDHIFEVGFRNMSSGQLAIITQLSCIFEAVKELHERGLRRVLILIDEGDAFLHLEWQRKYISHLNRMLSMLKDEYGLAALQVILATHSPLLATDVPKEFVCRMEANHGDETSSAFAAPLHELINQSFGAKTVGEFASRRINEVVSNASQGVRSELADFIVSSIDNPIIKAEVLRRVKGEAR
ncbi:AAA family ATPase [Pseudomonas sp. TWI628]|uniref:AAA family ATPase n=1 Tax=Pseudomonas sp. TWI628 TaxID=3136788 RepID=UPI00320AD6FC